jgi:hypothetical protein
VRAMLDYTLDVFERADLNDLILENRKTNEAFAKTHPALSVG